MCKNTTTSVSSRDGMLRFGLGELSHQINQVCRNVAGVALIMQKYIQRTDIAYHLTPEFFATATNFFW